MLSQMDFEEKNSYSLPTVPNAMHYTIQPWRQSQNPSPRWWDKILFRYKMQNPDLPIHLIQHCYKYPESIRSIQGIFLHLKINIQNQFPNILKLYTQWCINKYTFGIFIICSFWFFVSNNAITAFDVIFLHVRIFRGQHHESYCYHGYWSSPWPCSLCQELGPSSPCLPRHTICSATYWREKISTSRTYRVVDRSKRCNSSGYVHWYDYLVCSAIMLMDKNNGLDSTQY